MKKISKRILGTLLTFVMLIGLVPVSSLPVFAGHSCPDCQEWIDGSPYCDECYACDTCVVLCMECGKCTECTGAEICDGCSDGEGGNVCTDCSEEKGYHCDGCGTCYFETVWCDECGQCEDCCPICEKCSAELGCGVICWDCAEGYESHCPGCGGCYFESGGWCEDCLLCDDCSFVDILCSEVHGAVLCEGCAAERGSHCVDCGQCYFEVGGWCEECGHCEDCSPACLYCCEEAGAVICEECAIEAGMHCPECSDCYDGGEYCMECGLCTACADYCATDELCLECAVAGGYHCPNCEECGDAAVICEGCGEFCIDCADAFCENCNLCSACVLICQGCGSCEDCATICPNCEEYCSECEGLCDDCEYCLVCCADIASFEGCDCGVPVCVESLEWAEHFADEHTASGNAHSGRPSSAWTRDDTYHWQACVYCDSSAHITGKAKHTYNAGGRCTVCYYVKDAKIQILSQPRHSRGTFVTSVEEDYDARNIARFSVVAQGDGELTYTWCRKQYVGGVLTYVPLTHPWEGECYDGPTLDLLVPEDACCTVYTYACIITDEAGNEVQTNDVTLSARHDYQYYKQWRTHKNPYEYAERNQYGHVLQCVGEECGEVSRLYPHEDENDNGYCDVCDYEIGAIFVKKQPRNSKTALSYDPDVGYDEENIAHFSVVAQGDGELTYTWCRKQYVGGVLTYVPLTHPWEGECYDGPTLDLLVPEDACCTVYTYACIITDEAGNETRTVDVTLTARHNYQYYRDYFNYEDPLSEAKKKYHGHVLQCVSPACGKVSRMRQHVDEDRDYICDICDSKKDMYEPVGIFVTPPREGEFPSYTVTVDRPACYFAMGDENNYTQYRFWFVSDNGVDNWRLIDKNTPFVAGKYYKFAVEMKTKEGYEFGSLVSYDGEEPYEWVTVNGNYTKAHKTYGMDVDHYRTVSYEFGMCNDSVIENIVIDNVTEPVAGQKPTYSATVRGSGYYVDVSKNVCYDDWMNGRKLYYIKNGVGWFDVTVSDWVYENETFIPGHRYQVCVYLKTEDGYTFYHDRWYEMLFTASVNGTGAEGNTTNNLGLTEQTISAEFLCQPQALSTVMVYDLEPPRVGETPDYTVMAVYPDLYRPDPNYAGTNGVIWYDSRGEMLEPTDTFVQGEQYKVEIKVISAQLNGADVCAFASDTAAYLDGVQVVAKGDWDNVYVSRNAVYIYYTFEEGALPPARKGSVSGYVTDEGNTVGDITLQLIPQGLPEPAYETVLTGNTMSYRFARVPSGVYTLKAQKAGYPTVTYTVTVADTAVIQNVTLKPASAVLHGDVNGSGAADSNDARLVLQYAVKKIDATKLDLSSADVNGDGKVDSNDARIILQYAVKKISKFPVEG